MPFVSSSEDAQEEKEKKKRLKRIRLMLCPPDLALFASSRVICHFVISHLSLCLFYCSSFPVQPNSISYLMKASHLVWSHHGPTYLPLGASLYLLHHSV